MYAWLSISIELREAAVQTRKRRSDLFSEPKSEESDGEEIEDDDDLEGQAAEAEQQEAQADP